MIIAAINLDFITVKAINVKKKSKNSSCKLGLAAPAFRGRGLRPGRQILWPTRLKKILSEETAAKSVTGPRAFGPSGFWAFQNPLLSDLRVG
ncbi:hypothetical protein GJ744_010641 [Endocarpon pusillum]|uniref:Uncharacterized protein n=1 Tax=Endocarpon pusillum TaxID=364733 RepID=A0A8H7AY38_9EURO|nr:hypothetical protein GJ744_010641 [Endocarpon pusillum]